MNIDPNILATPSLLIVAALNDLEVIEKDPNYVITFSKWHSPFEGKCFVCLAGCLMAKSLGMQSNQRAYPELFRTSSETSRALKALDYFRCGLVDFGMSYLGKITLSNEFTYYPENRLITHYEESPTQFKLDMRKLADDFKACGL